MNDSYDAIVVGLGPAGGTFAQLLASRGFSVLAIDKRQVVGEPVRCGEGLTTEWLRYVRLPSKVIASRIAGAKLYSPSGHVLELRTPSTKGFVLERGVFDKHLAALAARAGARLAVATSALKLKRRKNLWSVLTSRNGKRSIFKTRLIVSAEGMEASIARQAGFNTFISPVDVDKCYEYELAGVDCRDEIEIWLSASRAPRGYIWLFPKGRCVANVGIGIGGHINVQPKAALDAFIASEERLRGASPVGIKVGVISVGSPLKKIALDGALVIGTAARQVDPLHGGGIGLALEAAHIAARVACAALESGDLSEGTLGRYEEEWRRVRGRQLECRLRLRKVLEALRDEEIDFIFNNLSANELRRVLDGDWKRVVVSLLSKRPSLLKALRALL